MSNIISNHEKNSFNKIFLIFKMTILLFNKACVYDKINNKTLLWGQYNKAFRSVMMGSGIKFKYIRSNEIQKKSFDFYLELDGRIEYIEHIIFVNKPNSVFRNINLYFPFEECNLFLKANSAIIVTMCKCFDDSNRLYEWIDYNLNLGFSGIVIFNNDNNLDEFDKESVYRTYNNNNERVFILDFDYKPIKNIHWNSIQKVTFNIGVNAFKNKCGKIALIDTDEFIYIPKRPYMNIEDFLLQFPKQVVTIQSNILTNKNLGDKIENNILDIALYIGEDKYTKVILDTFILKNWVFEGIFFNTSGHHQQRNQILLEKDEIIYYHCWINHRSIYKPLMPKITCLKDMKSKNKKWPIIKGNRKDSEIIIYDIWNPKSIQLSKAKPIQTLPLPKAKPIQTTSSPQVSSSQVSSPQVSSSQVRSSQVRSSQIRTPNKSYINDVSSIYIDMNKTGSLNSDEKKVLKKLLSRNKIDFSNIIRDYHLLGNSMDRLNILMNS